MKNELSDLTPQEVLDTLEDLLQEVRRIRNRMHDYPEVRYSLNLSIDFIKMSIKQSQTIIGDLNDCTAAS